jgi:hypothetical protein
MAPTAPRVISVQIPVDKIGELIGPKGKTTSGFVGFAIALTWARAASADGPSVAPM